MFVKSVAKNSAFLLKKAGSSDGKRVGSHTGKESLVFPTGSSPSSA